LAKSLILIDTTNTKFVKFACCVIHLPLSENFIIPYPLLFHMARRIRHVQIRRVD